MCRLHDELAGDCVSNITVDNTSDWSHELGKVKNRFLIIAYAFYSKDISYSEYERGLASGKIVMKMRSSAYSGILPYLHNRTSFQLAFTRHRNCQFIKQPFFLYPIAVFLNAFIVLVWVYSLAKSSGVVHCTQKSLTAILLLKSYNDIVLLFHIYMCREEGTTAGLESAALNTNAVLQPILKGLLIHLVLLLTLVSTRANIGNTPRRKNAEGKTAEPHSGVFGRTRVCAHAGFGFRVPEFA